MDIMEKLKYLILRITRICPKTTDYLCRRWNINTLSYWNKKYSEEKTKEHWSSQVRLDFYDLVATALPRTPATILDAGSGLGFGGKHLMEIYDQWQIEGLDFSEQACKNAVIKSHCVDLRTQDLPGKYDYILAVETLEHIPDYMQILDKLYNAARKAVIITVPYEGRKSTTHPNSFDEDSFKNFKNVDIKKSKRKAPDGKIKTDMMVIIKK